MITIWVFSNSQVFMMVAASLSNIITICLLPSWLPTRKIWGEGVHLVKDYSNFLNDHRKMLQNCTQFM